MAEELRTLEGLHALVVDDLELNRGVVCDLLSDYGAVVAEASDGRSAVAKIKSGHFDFVLMDIVMPGMDGFQTTRAIRGIPGAEKLPVFAMTAFDYGEIKDKVLEAGMNGYLFKPIRLPMLFALLARSGVVGGGDELASPEAEDSRSRMKYSFITSNPEIAQIAERYSVDRICVDLTSGRGLGRSSGKISHIAPLKAKLTKAKVTVILNPWSSGSRRELDKAIAAGADLAMLSGWRNPDEVKQFLTAAAGRIKTILRVDNRDALSSLDEVISLRPGEIFLSLSIYRELGRTYPFELYSDGTLDSFCSRLSGTGIAYGFGGLAAMGKGVIPPERILMEHYRLGSTSALLTSHFCDLTSCRTVDEVNYVFSTGMNDLRNYERHCAAAGGDEQAENKKYIAENVGTALRALKEYRT